MIIGTYFNGDTDEELKTHQHKCYYETLRRWVRMADEKCQKYVGVSTEWDELIDRWQKNVMESGGFDHRCIQAPHDLIAARFRKVALKEMPHAGSMKKIDAWRGFFNKEAAVCLDQKEMLLLFMTALAHSDSETGYDVENKLYKMMCLQYDHTNRPEA